MLNVPKAWTYALESIQRIFPALCSKRTKVRSMSSRLTHWAKKIPYLALLIIFAACPIGTHQSVLAAELIFVRQADIEDKSTFVRFNCINFTTVMGDKCLEPDLRPRCQIGSLYLAHFFKEGNRCAVLHSHPNSRISHYLLCNQIPDLVLVGLCCLGLAICYSGFIWASILFDRKCDITSLVVAGSVIPLGGFLFAISIIAFLAY